ncbi:MAG TPA: PilT/PilU family type 4a pilus ATPase [Methylomirabilota bacterium]|nr:PilT/PilU family type 4a pilus ATPase [Methylomirabilota bacterium]
MTFDDLIGMAREQGASDLHLEGGMPAAIRVRGALQTTGEPIPSKALFEMARAVLGDENWAAFQERRSHDLSLTIRGVRCRINVLQTARGIGFAVRLLSSFQATLESLNLHPDLKRFLAHHNGLILVSGATGSGKSSTLAALIQELNLTETLHVVTVESPIEYAFRPRKSFIRQREVGRDTPSFEQALLDALREDPDVLMVGEMRDPETMRLTLSAAETGHLVLATVHSSTCIEALQRVVGAFPAEIQNSVAAQLADCLVGVIAQRLHFRPDLKIRLPECEILAVTHPVKTHIRNRDFFKITPVMETGGDHGMWTFQRYRNWMERKRDWHVPSSQDELPDEEPGGMEPHVPTGLPHGGKAASNPAPAPSDGPRTSHKPPLPSSGRIEIEPVEGEFGKILRPSSSQKRPS